MTFRAPLVSVVIPAYNAARTLPVALGSVINQTIDNFEIIVVDDGSTDSTADVARSFADARIRVLQQINAGHAAARNTGVAAAKGVYVGFLDADNLWLPQKLEHQLAWLRENPELRAVQAGTYFVDDDLTILYEHRCVVSRDPLLDSLCFRNLPDVMSTLIAKRTLLQEIGGFDSTLPILQDWDLAIRLSRLGYFSSMPEALSAYRLHEGNQSRNVGIHVPAGLRVLDKVFSDPELPLYVRRHRREIYAHFYTMLCGGEARYGRLRQGIYWAIRAVLSDPRALSYVLATPVRRLRKRRSRHTHTETSVSHFLSIAARGSRAFSEGTVRIGPGSETVNNADTTRHHDDVH